VVRPERESAATASLCRSAAAGSSESGETAHPKEAERADMGVSSSAPAPAKPEEEPFSDHVTEPHSEFQRTETDSDPQAQIARAQEQGWIALAGVMYENAVKALIRPPRDVYGSRELGPTEFRFRGRAFIRKDFVLRNPRGMLLQCSHWMPADAERPSKKLPCVVCLHGNSSSRVSAKFNLEVVLNEVGDGTDRASRPLRVTG